MAAYSHLCWTSADGLKLHARDYPGDDDGRPVVVCLHGLTRNARDFAALAEKLSPAWRVLAIDFRGRGESAHARDAASYTPATYVEDVAAMLAEAGVERFATVGTSLGGIVTMMLAGAMRGRLAGALLNDIGPSIEPAGLARLRSYVGRGSSFPTWLHAARAVAEVHRDVYPDWGLDRWLDMAKRLYRVTSAGRIVLDYDLKIAEPFRVPGAEAGADMWGALTGLAGLPVLVVRGERSDLLSAQVAERMMAALPGAELVTVPRVGHAPTLDEAGVAEAIGRWLERIGEPARG